jgi:hypothetical protein
MSRRMCRRRPGPFDWGPKRLGDKIARKLGRIDSATVVRTPRGGLVAILRAGSRLYELTHRRANLPAGYGAGWSHPAKLVTTAGSAIHATGDPVLTVASLGPDVSRLALVVAVPGGLAVLTTPPNSASPWALQQLPVHERVNSASILGGEVGGRLNTEVIYRSGSQLYSTWEWDGGAWHQPAIVRWGSP